MKRAEQLQGLSREHHCSLVIAKQLADVAENGSDDELLAEIEKLKKYYNIELEIHFQHEERTIFAPIYKKYKEHVPIAMKLLKEHGAMRMAIPQMTLETAKQDLAEFAKTLKNHTRVEERELFPIIEELFSEEELDAVLNFVPLD